MVIQGFWLWLVARPSTVRKRPITKNCPFSLAQRGRQARRGRGFRVMKKHLAVDLNTHEP